MRDICSPIYERKRMARDALMVPVIVLEVSVLAKKVLLTRGNAITYQGQNAVLGRSGGSLFQLIFPRQ